MADEKRLHELLDLVEQARNEGDKDTEAKAISAYKRETSPGRPEMSFRDPNEVDPVSGKTRAQLEAELQRFNNPGLIRRIKDWAITSDTPGQRSPASEATHKIGMYGRDAAIGGLQAPAFLADIASLPMNIVPWAYDKIRSPRLDELVTGKSQRQLMPISGQVEKLDQALADKSIEPETAGERIGSGIRRAVSGTLMTMGAGNAAPLATTKLGNFLASSPKTQIASAVTGSTASGVTREMGGSPTAQLIAGLAGGFAPSAAKFGWQRFIGEPNQSGKELLSRGVDLTPGQQKAGGAYSQIEDASTHLPIIGGKFQAAKDAAQQQAKEAFILEAAAPGSKVPPTGDLQQTLEQVGKTFEPAYDAVSGFPLVLDKGKPVIVNQGANVPLTTAFKRAVADRSVDATAATRQQADSWLSNLLTRPIKSSEDLISLRSEIRSRINSLAKDTSSEVMARREIYQNAANQVTKALESQLPSGLMQNLKAVDTQYAKYKTAVDAMAKGGDRPGGFTWNEASAAAKASAQGALGKDAYARGEGFMRDIPAASRTAFATRPPTGASLTAQAAAYPALAVTVPLSLTKTGRAIAANNKVMPFDLAPAATAANASQVLTKEDRRKKIAEAMQ